MKHHLTAEEIARIRKRPELYVGSCDIRGIYRLLFGLVKEIISASQKTGFVLEIQIDEGDALQIACDFSFRASESLTRYTMEELSGGFELAEGRNCCRLRFKPDRKVFSYESIAYPHLYSRLTELAQLNKNMTVLLADSENSNLIRFPRGLETMLMEGVDQFGLRMDDKPLNLWFSKEDVEVEVSMIYANAQDVALSFVNNDKSRDGGSHVEGLYNGLLNAFREYVKNVESYRIKDHPLFHLVEKVAGEPYRFDKNPKILREDVTKDLNFVISLTTNTPHYGCRELKDEKVYAIVEEGISENVLGILRSDPLFFYLSRVIQKAEIRKILSD